MIIDKIEKWIDVEEEWFVDFLTEMTTDEKYGDVLSGSYLDDMEIDGDDIYISYSSSNRCGESDYYSATIPVEHVINKLRTEKLEKILKN